MYFIRKKNDTSIQRGDNFGGPRCREERKSKFQ